jgi:PAS domain S-box-containing protein
MQRGLLLLAVPAGYYVCALIGTVLSVPPSGFAIVWPATPFLIGVLLVTPPKWWWAALIGVIPAHFHLVTTFQNPPPPFLVMLSQIAGNLFSVLSTVLIVRWAARGSVRLDTFGAMLRFILLAGLLVPAVVNALILSLHVTTGWASDFWHSWRQWMVACVFPSITIPPLMVTAFGALSAPRPTPRSFYLELSVLAAGLFLLSFAAFGQQGAPAHGPAVLLTPFPFLLWAAVRLGVAGACVALITLASASIAQALLGHGPFSSQASIDDIISLQAFLISFSVPMVLLAALMEERRRTEELLKRSEERMKVVTASTDTGLWQWDEVAKQLWLTAHCRTMFGLEADAVVSPEAFLKVVHPEDRARVGRMLRSTLILPDVEAVREFRVVRGDGEPRWFIVRAHTEFDVENRPIRVSGVFRDITQRIAAQQEAEQLAQRLLTLQDEERRSIAEELHDSTAQHLVAINLNLSALRRQVAMPDESRSLMDEILTSLRDATTELRNFTYLLRPPELDDDDLSVVLQRYLAGFERRTGLRTTLKTGPLANQLPRELRRAVFRIVQEGLANVHRHASAAHVSVNLRCVGGRAHLVISDDGKGMSLISARRGGEQIRLGVGLPSMAARIRQLGGRIEVSSTGKGTTVHVVAPIGGREVELTI